MRALIKTLHRLAHYAEFTHLAYLITAAGVVHEYHAYLAGAAATTVAATIAVNWLGGEG